MKSIPFVAFDCIQLLSSPKLVSLKSLSPYKLLQHTTLLWQDLDLETDVSSQDQKADQDFCPTSAPKYNKITFKPCGKESTEVRKSQIKGKESENSYQELKRSRSLQFLVKITFKYHKT